MTLPKFTEPTIRLYVKLLSLLVAALLSLFVTSERPGETTLRVPVRTSHVPAGLRQTSALNSVEVTVAGPKILLPLLPMHDISCEVDLSGAAAGPVKYVPGEGDFDLPDKELKIVRVHPAELRLMLTGTNQ